MFEGINTQQKAIILIIVLLAFAVAWPTIQAEFDKNPTLLAVLATAIVVAVICYFWFRKPEKVTYLDPKTAANLFFTQTKTGDDILTHFGVGKRKDGEVPMLNLGKCEFPVRGDGVAGIVGPMFPNDDTNYILVVDLKNRKVSDENTNLIHFGYGFFDLKNHEKELERLVPADKSPFEKAAQKLLHDRMLKRAEDIAEEM